MHEGNFTEKIVSAVLEQAIRYPDKKAVLIHVHVGEIYHLNPDSVRAHFEILIKDTRLEQTKLELLEVPATIECERCHWIGQPDDHHLLYCSECNSQQVNLIDGDTITVDSIEFEEKSRSERSQNNVH